MCVEAGHCSYREEKLFEELLSINIYLLTRTVILTVHNTWEMYSTSSTALMCYSNTLWCKFFTDDTQIFVHFIHLHCDSTLGHGGIQAAINMNECLNGSVCVVQEYFLRENCILSSLFFVKHDSTLIYYHYNYNTNILQIYNKNKVFFYLFFLSLLSHYTISPKEVACANIVLRKRKIQL